MTAKAGAGGRGGTRKRGGRAWVGRLVVLGVLAAALWFAVAGGEYSTLDLFSQRSQTAMLHHNIGALQHEVDSLAAFKHAVETDPATQERIAREEFGMVRGNKELLYRFVAPRDSTKR